MIYQSTITCRDERSRTLTISTSGSSGMKMLTVTGLQIEMSKSSNPFDPLRYQTGKITVQCINGISPADFMPTWKKSHQVTIMCDGKCEFFGYVMAESRSQDYPPEGEEFDISIISPLGMAESEVLNDSKRSYELDDMFYLISSCLSRSGCDGSTSVVLPILWTWNWHEQIARYNSMGDVGDTEIDSRGYLRTQEPQSLSCAEILTNIARFYGVSIMELGHTVFFIAPDKTNYCYATIDEGLSASGYFDFHHYEGNMSSSVGEIVGLPTQDIELSPCRIIVNTDIDSADSEVINFTDEHLYRNLPIDEYLSNEISREVRISEDSQVLGYANFHAIMYARESVDHLLEAIAPAQGDLQTDFRRGGGLYLFAPDPYFKNSGCPEGLVVCGHNVSSTGAETDMEVLRMHSPSVVMNRAVTFQISMKVSSLIKTNMPSPGVPEYIWYPCNSWGSEISSGYVEVKFRVGNVESQWQRLSAYAPEEGETSYKEDVRITECFSQAPFNTDNSCYGDVEIILRCHHKKTLSDAKLSNYYCSDIFLSDIKVETIDRSSDDVSSANINTIKLKNFRFSYNTNHLGEAYEYNLPFTVYRPDLYCPAFNGIFLQTSTKTFPFHPTSGFRQYEQDMLERLKSQLTSPLVSFNLPIEITDLTPFVTYNGSTHMLTGVTRDYMNGIDNINITSISQ